MSERFTFNGEPYGHISDTASVPAKIQMSGSGEDHYPGGRFLCESVSEEVAAWLVPLLNANADKIPVIKEVTK